MLTYSGYINGAAFIKHLADFIRTLDESVIRMRKEKELSVGGPDELLEGGKEGDE